MISMFPAHIATQLFGPRALFPRGSDGGFASVSEMTLTGTLVLTFCLVSQLLPPAAARYRCGLPTVYRRARLAERKCLERTEGRVRLLSR